VLHRSPFRGINLALSLAFTALRRRKPEARDGKSKSDQLLPASQRLSFERRPISKCRNDYQHRWSVLEAIETSDLSTSALHLQCHMVFQRAIRPCPSDSQTTLASARQGTAHMAAMPLAERRETELLHKGSANHVRAWHGPCPIGIGPPITIFPVNRCVLN
jgi:hypothetical protein